MYFTFKSIPPQENRRERETTRKRDRTPALTSLRHLKHHWDCTPAPARRTPTPARRTPVPTRSHTTMSSNPHPTYLEKHNPIPISANPHPPDLAPPEAPPRSHPRTGEIAPITHPCPISLFLDLPLPFPHLSVTLSSSFSPFDRVFELWKCFVLIFVWFCFDFCLF